MENGHLALAVQYKDGDPDDHRHKLLAKLIYEWIIALVNLITIQLFLNQSVLNLEQYIFL